jgi:hypothetical protein
MGDIEEAVTRMAEAIRARGTVPEDVLIGFEQLRGVIGKWLSTRPATLYAPAHGRWCVSPSGGHLDLSKRGTMRRIVAALVAARIERPGESLSSADLVAAGWPEDIVVNEASTNRLRVTLFRLRQLGLESVIVTTGEGWMLDPAIPVIRGDGETETEAAPDSRPYPAPAAESVPDVDAVVQLAS